MRDGEWDNKAVQIDSRQPPKVEGFSVLEEEGNQGDLLYEFPVILFAERWEDNGGGDRSRGDPVFHRELRIQIGVTDISE